MLLYFDHQTIGWWPEAQCLAHAIGVSAVHTFDQLQLEAFGYKPVELQDSLEEDLPCSTEPTRVCSA